MDRAGVMCEGSELFGACIRGIGASVDRFGRPDTYVAICESSQLS